MATFLTIAFCLAILGVGVQTWVQISRAKKRAVARITGVHAVVDEVPPPATVQHRAWLHQRAQEQVPDVAHLWGEYNETLVVEREGRLLNTVDAEHYFRTDTLAPELLHNRVLTTRPAVLTVLGVFGTFVGLAFGLSHIDLSGSADELTAGVRDLINGASFAFYTSVAGVLASLVVQAREKWVARTVTAQVEGVQTAIDRLFHKQTSEASLVSIMNSSEESQKHLAVLGEQIGSKLQETVGSLAGDLRESVDHMQRSVEEAITSTIAPEMERIATMAAQQSSDIFEGLVEKFAGRFEQIGITLADRLDNASATMSTTLDYLGSRMAQQADEHAERMEEMRSASQRQVELLDKHLPLVVERLDEATAQLDSVSEQLAPSAENLRATAESFEATSTAFRDVLTDSVESFEEISGRYAGATDTITTLTERLEHLTSSAVAASSMLEEASGVLREGLAGMQEQQERSFDAVRTQQQSFLDALRAHQAEVLEKLAAEVDGFRTSLTAWFVDYSGAVKEQTDSRMNVWNEQTHAYTSTMLDAARALSAAVEDIEQLRVPSPGGGDETRQVAA
ncbi:anti-phage defense ZorAB system protein ZorA [Isoptericola sp. 4D.3]|uniref:Anti-phage defense ZorAB system protein ZorA n=1 Tax=Isoptericola peretonis TaxID=2918523 RepID=A0ABT0IYU7_9MICO|nr:anti-phage defense ZorAB system protein ZorA [Isoptericola sp. 4D.3]